MKRPKPVVDVVDDVDATHERTPAENEKLRRNKMIRKKEAGLEDQVPERNAAGLNEKEGKDELEDLYEEEENRGAEEGV